MIFAASDLRKEQSVILPKEQYHRLSCAYPARQSVLKS